MIQLLIKLIYTKKNFTFKKPVRELDIAEKYNEFTFTTIRKRNNIFIYFSTLEDERVSPAAVRLVFGLMFALVYSLLRNKVYYLYLYGQCTVS